MGQLREVRSGSAAATDGQRRALKSSQERPFFSGLALLLPGPDLLPHCERGRKSYVPPGHHGTTIARRRSTGQSPGAEPWRALCQVPVRRPGVEPCSAFGEGKLWEREQQTWGRVEEEE